MIDRDRDVRALILSLPVNADTRNRLLVVADERDRLLSVAACASRACAAL